MASVMAPAAVPLSAGATTHIPLKSQPRSAGKTWRRRLAAPPGLACSAAEGGPRRRGLQLRCRASASSLAAQEEDLYSVLGVPKSADRAELKRAYRKKALEFHPDVNPEPSAQQTFVALSTAYEVLVDEEQRAVYDKHGLAGLRDRGQQRPPAKGAAWEAWDTWEEFQPHERKTRKGDARQAAAASSGGPDQGAAGPASEAQLGDVVEYPLSEAARAYHDDGRGKGVGFVVGRNRDRGDRDKLPAEAIDKVELEVLYQEDPGSSEWRTDPMESAAFANLPDLRVLSTTFDKQKDVWTLLDNLSSGCGSPVYNEEVIL